MTVDQRTQRAADPIEGALLDLLGRHPAAMVAGLEDVGDGHPRLIAPPAELAPPGAMSQDASSMIDHVVAADRVAVARMWGRARLRGISAAVVRLIGEVDPGTLYCFDLRERHRMMVAVFLPGITDSEGLANVGLPASVPARFARASKSESAVFLSVDPALTQILGWPMDELLGRPTLELIHPDDREDGIEAWMEMLDHPGPGRRVRLRHRHRDGSWIWLEVTNHNRLSDPTHRDVLCEMVDISEEMAAQEGLKAREQLLAQLTEAIPIALFHTSVTGDLLFANRRLQDLTASPLRGTLEQQLAGVAADDHGLVQRALTLASAGSDADVEFGLHADGDLRHCRMSLRPLIDGNGAVNGLTGCIEDITDSIRTRRELELKASSDPLTGCLNREAVLAAIQTLLDRHHPTQGFTHAGTAVVFMDLDGFKAVNDRFGHAAGDELLVSLTAKLRASIRSGDLIGRMGGDEFVVVCPEVKGRDEALAIAGNLHRRVFEAADADSPQWGSLLASAGVAWTDAVALPASALVDAADSAMYESKRAGNGEPVLAPPLAS